jgi:hypothetical protein
MIIILLLFFLLILIIALIIIQAQNTKLYYLTTFSNINGGKKQYTYKLFCKKKYCQYLKNKLNNLGWQEAHDNAKYVDFAYKSNHKLLEDNKLSYGFRHIKANLKSTLKDLDILGNKQQLATIMKNSPYISKMSTIKNYNWHSDDDVIIVREINSKKLMGVYILIDKESFIKLKNMLLAKKIDAMVNKYITNPLLYKGKKFHLRIYIIVFIDKNGNKKLKYMHNYIEIIIAKKKYIIMDKLDYLDMDISISGTDDSGIILWDINKCNNLSVSSINFFNKCNKSIDDAINSIPLDSLSLYPNEQSAGLYIYGGDIMLDTNGHAWILELNRSAGCHCLGWWDIKKHTFNKEFINYLSKVYDFLLNEFILPYFGH